MLPQYGLSEVRFFYIPVWAREPQPADGATTDNADVTLTWRAGREAVSHEVYLGTDSADLSLVGTVTDESLDLSDQGLTYGTTYFWKINEVNEAAVPASHEGPVWSFSVPDFAVVDNFDQYNDNCDRIFFAWLDGLGHNGEETCAVAAYNGNGTGSIVGNAQAPFAEQTIVISRQSLSLFYDNTGLDTAEARYDLPQAQDWSAHGLKSLSPQFHGDPDNSGQLYVKINNTKVTYDGPPDALQQAQWTPWSIDLSTVAGNLQAVTSLTIGIEGASDTGVVYVDEIHLYP